MAKTNILLPENYDPYDMRLKVHFHPQADRLNFIGVYFKNPILCCGGSTNGRICRKPAGWGTDHVGYGRCKFHGGRNTGPKTPEGKAKVSQNNLRHGLYSKTLLPEEAALVEEIEKPDFDALDYASKVQAVKIISYLQRHTDKFQEDRDKEGEEVAYRKSRVICREGDGIRTFYHAGTIEDNALDRAFNTLRRLIGQKHIIEGNEKNENDIMAAINTELKNASKGEISISWGDKPVSKVQKTE